MLIMDNSSTVLRGRRINFFDDVDVYYMAESLDWEHFRNNPKLKDMFVEKIQGYSERKVNNDDWDEQIKDCLYTSKNYGNSDTLIIVCANENWLQEDLFFVPPAVMKYRKSSDILVIKEEMKNNKKPFMHNLIMGINSEYNTFEKMCKLLRTNYINEGYKNVVLIAGGDVLCAGLAIAQEFSDCVNNAFLYDGATCNNWDESTFVQRCHHMSVKAEYIFQKTNTIDDRTNVAKETEDALFVLKAGYFARHKINKRLTSPFKFITDHPNLNVNYCFWKDNHHIDWLRAKVVDSDNFIKSNIKDDNPPSYTFSVKLPIFLHKILDK